MGLQAIIRPDTSPWGVFLEISRIPFGEFPDSTDPVFPTITQITIEISQIL
jgi:hypothetical protein